MSEHDYWAIVRHAVESGQSSGLPKHEIREDIVAQVQAAQADGETWAAETLMRWEREGADRDYTKAFKDLNTVTYIRADGRRTRKTVAYSRPQRSVEDGSIIGQQMQAWWGMSRPAIEALRDEVASQAERMGDVVTALDQLAAAMDRHPDCKTAREAWEADGHDVSEIDLGEAL